MLQWYLLIDKTTGEVGAVYHEGQKCLQHTEMPASHGTPVPMSLCNSVIERVLELVNGESLQRLGTRLRHTEARRFQQNQPDPFPATLDREGSDACLPR